MNVQNKIEMVDLKGQYLKIKLEVNEAIQSCLNSASFIQGPEVKEFEVALANYLGVRYVIGCANGTDALQIAMMALELKPGDEIIVPAFTYIATAEVIALLGLKPIWVDVEEDSFNLDIIQLEKVLTSKTRAIVPVHLYGQCSNMEPIMQFAKKHNLFVIEDNAQAIGAEFKMSSGVIKKSGTIGHIGCTSFFPSKNLGCYGDGGALFTDDEKLAKRIKMIANHGQSTKYIHDSIGVNSRLDTIQAAILKVKLNYFDRYIQSRSMAAMHYDSLLSHIPQIQIPTRKPYSSHVFHQYTLRVKDNSRNDLKVYLEEQGIPSMIYYPIPIHEQKAYYEPTKPRGSFPVAEKLCKSVLSIPMHTELTKDIQDFIAHHIKQFYTKQ